MPTYKDAYAKAGGADKLGDYAAWEKKAKAWNKKKYGTTNPTADAKTAGITKDKLASKHKVDSTKFTESLTIDGKKTNVKDLGSEYTSYGVMAPKPRPTDNAANTSLSKTIGAANSDESLLGGTQTRREKRQADRKVNRENREANRIRHAGDKAVKKRANKERRQDARQERGDAKFKKRTGIDMSGTPTYSPQLDTGPGTYQGGPGTYQNPSKPKTKKKKSSGEGWGKSGVIERF